jgi:hypothetical protein
MANPDRVTAACKSHYAAHKGDCSGFVRAVAADLGVTTLHGLADDIVGTIRAGGAWTRLPNGVVAASSAAAGKLVIAGLKGAEQAHPDPHGHVVVVVIGPLAHDAYPTAWWGSLGGVPGAGETLNYAWTTADRDRITYAACDIPDAGR